MTKKYKKTNSIDSLSIENLRDRSKHYLRTLQRRTWILCILLLFMGVHYTLSLPQNTAITTAEPSDIVHGGIPTKSDIILEYDRKDSALKELSNELGITEDEITHTTEIASTPKSLRQTLVVWARSPNYQPPFSLTADSVPSFVTQGAMTGNLYYGHKIENPYPSYPTKLFHGHSSIAGDFAITSNGGNIITSWEASQRINSCYQSPNVDYYYLNCINAQSVQTSIDTTNLTQKINATLTKARANDILKYKVSIKNNTSQDISLTPLIFLHDVLEYTTLQEYPGAYFNKQEESLSWEKITLRPQVQATYTFKVRLFKQLPLTPQSSNNLRSYDCRLSLYFGGLSSTSAACPFPKTIEYLFIPSALDGIFTGGLWLLFCLNALLLLRSRILYKELLEKIERAKHTI